MLPRTVITASRITKSKLEHVTAAAFYLLGHECIRGHHGRISIVELGLLRQWVPQSLVPSCGAVFGHA